MHIFVQIELDLEVEPMNIADMGQQSFFNICKADPCMYSRDPSLNSQYKGVSTTDYYYPSLSQQKDFESASYLFKFFFSSDSKMFYYPTCPSLNYM